MIEPLLPVLTERLATQPLGLALPQAELAPLLSGLPLVPPVLDLACSDGATGALLAAGRLRLDAALDPDPFAVRQARRRGIHRQVVCSPGPGLPWPTDHFRTILLLDGLQRLAAPDDLLPELARILAPDGRIILALPRALASRTVRRLAGRLLFLAGGNGRPLLCADELSGTMENAGLSIARSLEYGSAGLNALWLASLPSLARARIYRLILGRWVPFPGLHGRLVRPLLLFLVRAWCPGSAMASQLLILRRRT